VDSLRRVTIIERERWDDRWSRRTAGPSTSSRPAAPGAAPATAPPAIDRRERITGTVPGTAAADVAPVDLVLWERALVAPRLAGHAPLTAPTGDAAWPRDPLVAEAAAVLGLGARFSQREVDRRFRAIVASERPDLGGVDGERLSRLRSARAALRHHLRTARWILPEQPT
jgi:hypothetical protein